MTAVDFQVICRLCPGLRDAQSRALLLLSRSALSKVATFLRMLEERQGIGGDHATEIHLVMSRSDIANYAGLSLEEPSA
jgi:CRP-like cAMP-binding protein